MFLSAKRAASDIGIARRNLPVAESFPRRSGVRRDGRRRRAGSVAKSAASRTLRIAESTLRGGVILNASGWLRIAESTLRRGVILNTGGWLRVAETSLRGRIILNAGGGWRIAE